MCKVNVDLHIHSVLSPCAHLLMTPGNIIRRALEVELDVIAITDHNSIGNLETALKIAADKPLRIIPGMEVESREEVHLLCYFKELDRAREWQKIVDENLPNIKNNEEFFGPQLLADENDNYIDRVSGLLAMATTMKLEDIVKDVTKLGGMVIPSHIERANGLINNLGLIPTMVKEKISIMELYSTENKRNLYKTHPFLEGYCLISNSDAHYLEDISGGIELGKEQNELYDFIKFFAGY